MVDRDRTATADRATAGWRDLPAATGRIGSGRRPAIIAAGGDDWATDDPCASCSGSSRARRSISTSGTRPRRTATSKETADEQLAAGVERLTELQDRLWAEAKHPVLVLIQGIDASGKDSTIRHVMGALNPQGVHGLGVQGPDPDRSRARLPLADPPADAGQGRDRDLQPLPLRGGARRPGPRARARRRCGRGDTSRSTPSSGSSPRRARRSSSSSCGSRRRSSASGSRSASTTRPSAGSSARADLDERERWADYQRAFEDALSRCSTEWAPWYVIPSNRKWFRNVAVAEILGDTIADLDPQYPPGEPGIERRSSSPDRHDGPNRAGGAARRSDRLRAELAARGVDGVDLLAERAGLRRDVRRGLDQPARDQEDDERDDDERDARC